VTEPSLLFDELQKAIVGLNLLPSGVTMNDVFGSWSNQAGYPIVTADRTAGDRITLKQAN
jgi:hypothetical protein